MGIFTPWKLANIMNQCFSLKQLVKHLPAYLYLCLCVCMPSHFGRVQLFVIHGLQPARLLCPWDSLGKNIGVGCRAILQEIFLTQALHLGLLYLLHCQAGSLLLDGPGIQKLYLSLRLPLTHIYVIMCYVGFPSILLIANNLIKLSQIFL